jgi:hypothetical protein
MSIHPLMEFTELSTGKVAHNPNSRNVVINDTEQSNNCENSHPCHATQTSSESQVEDSNSSMDNANPKSLLEYPSDPSDIDPEHPDYGILQTAKLHTSTQRS